ncbi:GNAT family protein [Patulibacter brassicae]|uniref:GNAT family protein n=1 Tax=Patulibacter brassicae TaxID=1705717 RepID=A0ABU4VP59_9ACTN|nr:GNAT family protein [Patulibacter brassicae]MDX8153419.1 GNAT family protein [Patulibacter brassicae]
MSLEVRGPTLTLRYPTAEDAEALLGLASDPEVTRWFSWGPYTDVEQPRRFIAGLEQERRDGVKLDLLAVHRRHGPAGITGLYEFHPRDRRCVCGTWFGRDFWGTGANRESKALLQHLAFETLGMQRFGSYSNPVNERSTRALQGVGLRLEGVLRGYHRHGEAFLDVNVFGLLREEWERSALRAEFAGAITVVGEPPAPFVAVD